MRAKSYLIILIILTACLIIFLGIMSEVFNKNNYGMNISWKKMKKVKKHFFFDLLPSFDTALNSDYKPSKILKTTQFYDIMDRILLSRYLVDRFEYQYFIQFGCRKDNNIYQLLPDTTVKTKLCIDKKEGSIRMSPISYLNSNLSYNKNYDLIVINSDLLSENYLDQILISLNEGGALLITDSNKLQHFSGNKTIETPRELNEYIVKFLSLRSQYDLDIATLDTDGGECIYVYMSVFICIYIYIYACTYIYTYVFV